MVQFSSTTPGADILAAYQQATRISPISSTHKAQVLKDYGIAAGWAKGKSDRSISTKAADAVVARFKANQAKPANNPKPSTGTKPASGTSSGGPVSASFMKQTVDKLRLANKAGAVKPPTYALRSREDFEAWAMRQKVRQLGYDNTVDAKVAIQIPDALRKYGLPETSRPPRYALRSSAELLAWAARARRYMLYGN